jgi:hypothetical protein
MEVPQKLNHEQKVQAYHVDRDLIDIQVATAKNYPRNITKFKENCKVAVSQTKEIAESCIYTLPKKGKPTGPSVHLARVVIQNYGNLRVESKIVGIELKHVTAESISWDLESNLAVKIQVQRSIWGKEGRYSEEMIAVTSNAAIAIALRNSVFNVIPREIIDDILGTAKKAILGDTSGVKFVAKRKQIIQGFKDIYGVTEQEILSFVDRQAVELITEDDLISLIGVGNAIKGNEATVEETFRPKKKDFVNIDTNEPENRLLLLIKAAKTLDELEKHRKHLKTNDERIAFDERFNELKNI